MKLSVARFSIAVCLLRTFCMQMLISKVCELCLCAFVNLKKKKPNKFMFLMFFFYFIYKTKKRVKKRKKFTLPQVRGKY